MKRIISVITAGSIALSCFAVSAFTSLAADKNSSVYAQETVQGGAILHCFDWSYDNITAKLEDIYNAGYTAVQVSPVQTPKDYSPSYEVAADNWWKMYQPLDFKIADKDENWFGGEAELKRLCDEAELYDIKVIVDIVANHLAEDGSKVKPYRGVDPALRDNPDYWHKNQSYPINYSDRRSITQDSMGMPDLNTSNKDVQNYVLDLLKACVDCGVDGFRFDAAKHIEVPEDEGFGSDFWPTVIGGINEYRSGLFIYGEILGNALTDINNYTEFMAVTDDGTSTIIRESAKKGTAKKLVTSAYQKGVDASQAVIWAESHDNYTHNESSGLSDTVIQRAWAIAGSRADSTALYLARPDYNIGEASEDDTWKSVPVVEVNKFKNYFDGTEEYLSSRGKVACNIRNGEGAVIVNLADEDTFELPNPKDNPLKSGTYTDKVSGNTITVTAEKISGKTDSSGVAVIYNSASEPDDTVEPTQPEGSVTVGDVNSDGDVNAKDRIVLTRFLSKWSSYTVNEQAADVNRDGSVNAKDRIILTRFLAKWAGYETL